MQALGAFSSLSFLDPLSLALLFTKGGSNHAEGVEGRLQVINRDMNTMRNVEKS